MDQYRVFGNPINHSRSPYIHCCFAQQTDQQLNYQSQFVELTAFAMTIKQFSAQGGRGANVTVPFKEQALSLCDQLSERARLAGAVNTLSFNDGVIIGDNTDGLGLVQDLLNNDVVLKNSRVLLLGAGGAARGVILPLLEQQISKLVIANRTVSKAQDLCQQFTDTKLTAIGFNEIEEQPFDLIINATSASLSGDVPPISEKLIARKTVCYDMVYGKELTPFLNWAKMQGSDTILDGLGMLVGQAAESFKLWRGVKPETSLVLNKLREELMQGA